MTDTIRIKSTLPLAITITEPHPDPEHPGNSPALKSAILRPGVNEVDADVFHAWAGSGGKDFVASSDDVKAGNTDGKVFEMSEDEPDMEFGFEPALKRAVDAGGADAEKGSTHTDPGPVKAEDMKTGSADTVASPALNAQAPLKLPITDDGSSGASASKAAEAPVTSHGEHANPVV